MLRSIFQVTSLGLLVQVLGFAKLLLIADYYGIGADLDSYYLALILPSLLQGFVGGGLQSGFMPIYGGLLTDSATSAYKLLRSQIFTWLLIVLLPLCGLVVISTGWLLEGLSLGASEGVMIGATAALGVLIFSFLLNAIVDYWGLILNSHNRFTLSAAAPLANVMVSSMVIVLAPEADLKALVWSLMAGLLTQLLVVLTGAAVIGVGLVRIQLSGLISSNVKRVFFLFLPALLGVAVTNANFAIDQSMAAGIETGSLSVLNYASRFHNLFVQVGIMGVSLVVLPAFVSMVAKQQYKRLFSLLNRILAVSLLLSLVVCLGIYLLGGVFLDLVLGFTAVDEIARSEIYWVWLWYAVGLFATASSVFYVKLFQAWKMPGFITVLAVVSLLLNVILNYLFIGWFGVAGIAMSTSLVYVVALSVFMIRAKMLKAAVLTVSVVV